MTDFVRVASVGDFEQGKLYNFKVDERYVAVVRNGDRFYAMRNSCAHSGFFLTPGDLVGDQIYCPAHGAYFRLEDGEPTAGPADGPLELYDVRIEGSDILVAPR